MHLYSAVQSNIFWATVSSLDFAESLPDPRSTLKYMHRQSPDQRGHVHISLVGILAHPGYILQRNLKLSSCLCCLRYINHNLLTYRVFQAGVCLSAH